MIKTALGRTWKKGLGVEKQQRFFSGTMRRGLDFEYVIIGAGITGISTAYSLTTPPLSSPSSPSRTLLLDRHPRPGTETSSRNSEVIHTSLYHPPLSLKTLLCLRGRELLYPFCQRYSIPHRKTGKWLLAQNKAQTAILEGIIQRGEQDAAPGGAGIGLRERIPLRWVSRQEVEGHNGERDVRVNWEEGGSVLESPEAGIVDSHSLMMRLLGLFEEREGAVLGLNSCVVGLRPLPTGTAGGLGEETPGSRGWEVTIRDRASGDVETITTQFVVNASGLAAGEVANLVLRKYAHNRNPSPYLPHPPGLGHEADGDGRHPGLEGYQGRGGTQGQPRSQAQEAERDGLIHTTFAKGNYFTYTPIPTPGRHKLYIKRLLYPTPVPGAAGLGTHLTLDLAGRIRFGPDVEWLPALPAPKSCTTNKIELETMMTTFPAYDYAVSPTRRDSFLASIQTYLPDVRKEDLVPDYSGIRPKIVLPLPTHSYHNKNFGGGEGSKGATPSPGFVDFAIRLEPGFSGWVNCMGIESPGLTAGLAVGEMVAELLDGKTGNGVAGQDLDVTR